MKDYDKKKRILLLDQDYKCKSCGIEFHFGEKIDLAHKIKASNFNYKEYGEDVIDHVLNLGATHHTNKCNDGQNMSRAAHPVECIELIERIKQDILNKA